MLLPVAASADSAPIYIDKISATYTIRPNIYITKVCIGTQFYLITTTAGQASGITPALANGKPEQCKSS
ncbi:hypothetical protein D3C80_2158620 [compost metagenome]